MVAALPYAALDHRVRLAWIAGGVEAALGTRLPIEIQKASQKIGAEVDAMEEQLREVTSNSDAALAPAQAEVVEEEP
jgi:hypothetical protein